MKILRSYLLISFIKNFLTSLGIFVILFITVDFIDRIDNILQENSSIFLIFEYFILKIPLFITLVFPISMLVSTLFTLGILAKTSELTAIRAAGISITWLSIPLFIFGLLVTGCSFLIDQTLVPYCTRRTKEIYNIDIRKKNQSGAYSQSNFWWRQEGIFFTANQFDSRTDNLYGLTKLSIDDKMRISRRIDSEKVKHLSPQLGWQMDNVTEYTFLKDADLPPLTTKYQRLPLTIKKVPVDFYDVEADPHSMSFSALKKFMYSQSKNGLPTSQYLADLYDKIAFPFLNIVIIIVVLPFTVKHSRSTAIMATTIIPSLIIGFSYYAIHSFFISLGRAEILNPIISTWFTNTIFFIGGIILLWGSDAS
jgi:lipopolysaccharide export system permease protein